MKSPPLVVDRSDERLTHFCCADPRCAQHWSIADFDSSRRWTSAYIYCPRCGRLHALDYGLDGVLAA